MKSILLSSALLVVAGTAAATPPLSAPVEIVNESVNVTVDNPQTEVKINNDSTNPVPVVVQGGVSGSSEPRFVGFSDDAVRADVGLVGLHGACKNKFGSGARMCTTEEVFTTPDLGSYPEVARAWVQQTDKYIYFTDSRTVNCRGWDLASSTYSSTVIKGEKMSLGAVVCTNLLPVTCCK